MWSEVPRENQRTICYGERGDRKGIFLFIEPSPFMFLKIDAVVIEKESRDIHKSILNPTILEKLPIQCNIKGQLQLCTALITPFKANQWRVYLEHPFLSRLAANKTILLSRSSHKVEERGLSFYLQKKRNR